MGYEVKNYDDAYNDKRLTDVKTEEAEKLSQLEQTFADRENAYNEYENKQNANIDKWEQTQTELQNKQTDFAIDEIERNKAQAKKDYTKEQSGAYVDWQKQSNQYGVKAEQMAAGGFTGSGYSESSQVAIYNQYQNRIAVARESYNNIIADYNSDITRARLNNDVQLAELANKAQEQRLNLMLQGVTYRDNLLSEKVTQKLQLESFYQTKWKYMLDQINSEIALEEEMRQFKANYDLEERKVKMEEEKWEAEKKATSPSSGNPGSPIINKNGSGNPGSDSAASSSKIVDTSNILSLGYGPISASQLNELVKQGKVIEYEENGVIKFRNAPSMEAALKNRANLKPLTPMQILENSQKRKDEVARGIAPYKR